jgi:Zinc finger, C3HC4 type (RING finger)
LFERWTPDEFRCVTVKANHGISGHQLKDGRCFANGCYTSSFSVNENRNAILNGIYFRLHHLLDRQSHVDNMEESQFDVAARIHQEIALQFSNLKEQGFVGFQYTIFCILCLFKPARHTLSCGHSFCTACIRVYGHMKGKTVTELYGCPLHYDSDPERRKQSIYIKPEHAGIRILSLDEYVQLLIIGGATY